MVSTLTFWCGGRGFESWPSQIFFTFFYQKQDNTWRNCDGQSLWARKNVKLELLHFSTNFTKGPNLKTIQKFENPDEIIAAYNTKGMEWRFFGKELIFTQLFSLRTARGNHF